MQFRVHILHDSETPDGTVDVMVKADSHQDLDYVKKIFLNQKGGKVEDIPQPPGLEFGPRFPCFRASSTAAPLTRGTAERLLLGDPMVELLPLPTRPTGDI